MEDENEGNYDKFKGLRKSYHFSLWEQIIAGNPIGLDYLRNQEPIF